MQKIKKLYRTNYSGENSISEMTYTNSSWVKTVNFVSGAGQASEPKGAAIVFGNGPSRTELYPQLFDLIKNDGTMKTYGCNAIMRDFTPDFVCASDAVMTEFLDEGYCDKTVVYGTSKMREQHPEKFYFIPQNPNWNMGATAAYLACFDGHKKVFLMGHDTFSDHPDFQLNVYTGTLGYEQEHSTTTEGYFEHTMLAVMNLYDDVEFVRVSPSRNFYMPESWKYQLNLRQIDFRDFVIESDLG
jgi:hypothetical protein